MTETAIPDNVVWADNLQRATDLGVLLPGGWGAWRGGELNGRTIVCALSSIRPGIRRDEDVPCPSVHMPRWMVPLIRTLFDEMRDPRAFNALIQPVMRRWHVLTPEAWDRIEVGFRVATIRAAEAAAAAEWAAEWAADAKRAMYRTLAERLFALIDAELEVAR